MVLGLHCLIQRNDLVGRLPFEERLRALPHRSAIQLEITPTLLYGPISELLAD
jgi:hypothetical protein